MRCKRAVVESRECLCLRSLTKRWCRVGGATLFSFGPRCLMGGLISMWNSRSPQASADLALQWSVEWCTRGAIVCTIAMRWGRWRGALRVPCCSPTRGERMELPGMDEECRRGSIRPRRITKSLHTICSSSRRKIEPTSRTPGESSPLVTKLRPRPARSCSFTSCSATRVHKSVSAACSESR